MIKLDQALANVTKIGFDTPPIIYFIEAHPQYDALVTDVFQRIAKASLKGYTSVITLSEVLIQPLRRSNVYLQQSYRQILTRTFNFQTLPINITIAEYAADLRARYNLRTPDALQIAAALSVGCEALLTNDSMLQRVTELRVLTLDELEL
nr:PIN domain protein [uncultured bacterium]